jgi:hypothetical protein
VDEHKEGVGKLFGDDIRDFRGTGPLNPRSFAELAVKQREFAACMVKEVSDHVFNQYASDDDRRALARSFEERPTLKSLMRTALLRYAERGLRDVARTEPAQEGAAAGHGRSDAASGRAGTDGRGVAFSPPLRELLSDHCGDCHRSGKRAFTEQSEVPFPTAYNMLEQVMTRKMPKATESTEALGKADRDRIIEALAEALWTDAAARKRGLEYLEYGRTALPVYGIHSIINVIRERTGALSRPELGLTEALLKPNMPQYTPGLAAVVSVEALRGCKETGKRGRELEQCLERATESVGLVNGSAAVVH